LKGLGLGFKVKYKFEVLRFYLGLRFRVLGFKVMFKVLGF
jgi:hypothetical protein